MRRILFALMLLALPLFGVASSTPASAAAPSGLTLVDKLAAPSVVEKARCYYRCHRVCAKRNYHGHCVYWTRKCHRVCHHGYYKPRYYGYGYRRW